jgi:hypothetical protein
MPTEASNRLARNSVSGYSRREEVISTFSLSIRSLEYQHLVRRGRIFSTKPSSTPASSRDLNSWRPSRWITAQVTFLSGKHIAEALF